MLSDGFVEYPPMFAKDEEEDIYGEQISAYHTPALKKRKIGRQWGGSSVSTPAKSSSSSSILSPVGSLDTPATSVSSSIQKVNSTAGTLKRKMREIIVIDDSDEFEFQMNDEGNGNEDDDLLSIAPTVISINSTVPDATTLSVPAAAQPIYRHARHQKRALKWKSHRLSHWERTNLALCEFHPELACIWDELETAPLITPVKVPQPDGLSLQLLPFQLEGLDWLLKQEQQARFGGGILADEMGMGKTIQTIALLLAEPRGKPNLVVAPTVALMQWKSEIETHTNNGLSVGLFYGQNRSVTAKQLKEYDVVLTTCILAYVTC
jgi:DNA repair protein RAD16